MGNLAGKSCGTRKREKSLFKKGSHWWKFSIWNRVKGSQPIRIQLVKIWQENLVGNSCRKFLWDKEEGKRLFQTGSGWWKFSIWNRVKGSQPIRIQLGKILWENLVGNSCRKFLWDKEEGKRLFKKGSGWWEFSIWNRVMGSQPISIQLGKMLQDNLAGKSCGNILWEIAVGKSCRKCLQENLVG